MDTTEVILLVLILLFILSSLAYGYRTAKVFAQPLSQDQRKKFYKLLSIMIAGYLLVKASDLMIRGLLDPVGYFITDVASVIVGIILAKQLFGFTGSVTDEDVEGVTRKVINSDHFLSALNASLPKGHADEEYGLDYIPYMLQNFETRRKIFQSKANFFLSTTIILGLSFAAITVYFGYVLLNDQAAGSSKTLSKLEIETREIKEKVPLVFSFELNKNVSKAIDEAEKTAAKVSSDEASIFKSAVTKFEAKSDLLVLVEEIKKISSNMKETTRYGREYKAALERVDAEITKSLNEKEAIQKNIYERTNEIQKLIAKAEEQIQKPDSRYSEILKRLSIGLVVVSFFLVILRYTSNLYRINFEQVIKATQDDDKVRKFYVSFKAAGENAEQRAIVLKSIMADTEKSLTDKVTGADCGLSKSEADLLKELLSALAKKI